MKKPLFVSALVLGASMFVAAQQAPPASTPPTFPSDSTQQQTPAQQRPDAMPGQTAPTATPQSTAPDTSAPSSQSDQSSSSSGKAQSIEGCVSQDTGMAGGYVLTDNSGMKYTLAGDTSKLSSFVGQEVKVKGTVAAGSASSSATADQSSSTASGAPPAGGASSAAAQQQLTVKDVKKVADTCSNAAPAK
jgi:hypothetical protein